MWLRVTFQLTTANAHALAFNKNRVETLNGIKNMPFQKGRNERSLHKLCLFAFAIIPLRKESLCKGQILLML